ncbi:U3 small nucleolar RNA-associated protein 25 homolog [Antedon mediterranea]|uniref:U3 small nucleolar RNA-associated protein 25 homolog n=1 Tax=Antedon mediterranea TaxID=105859 RepID=UPI003AF61CF3
MRGKGKRQRNKGGMRGRGRGRGSKKRRVDIGQQQRPENHNFTAGSALQATNSHGATRNLKSRKVPPSLLQQTEENWSSESEDENPLYQLLSSFGDRKLTNTGQYEDVDEEKEEEDSSIYSENDVDSIENIDLEGKENIIADDEEINDLEDDSDEEDEDIEDEDAKINEAFSTEELTADDYKDPFFKRVNHTMTQEDVEKLKKKANATEMKWPQLGKLKFYTHEENDSHPRIYKEKSLAKLYVRKKVSVRWSELNQKQLESDTPEEMFCPLQREVFSIMNNYNDILFCNRTHVNAEELRNAYCLHVLNHMIKSRQVVLKHNTMLSQDPNLDADLFRDQGLTRPRVLILVPFRDAAYKIVNIFAKLLLPEDQQQFSHRKRFNQDYGDEMLEQTKIKRPVDFESTFAGNIDDHFRLGVAISRKGIRLYTDFYRSDIIIASPLGLRTVLGAEGDKDRDWDFLSSIEVLVIDQADVFLMQNWEHLMHVINHLHLQPRQPHDVDFSRVRMWTLNDWSSYYRQTLILSEVSTPEVNALFNKKCRNFSGRVAVETKHIESICHVTTQLPQVFHKLECNCYSEDAQKRFDFFIKKVLPQYSDAVMARTLIFIPSYFDFVRVRNHFRKNELNFAQICEYTSQPNISRARHHLVKGTRHLLLYTERFHYYHRYKLKGVRHIVFYQLPTYPQFFSELCNMIDNRSTNNFNCSIIYSKFDAQRLAGVVGTERCSRMLSSDKDTHLLVTGT